MFKYICEDCFAVTNEDVWTCGFCGDDTRIHQVEIVTSDYLRVLFHRDVNFALSRKLIKYVIPNTEVPSLNVDCRINAEGRIVYVIK